ncbi:hypothetical protein RND71_026927 [Anisodus tanguticus]|uniref:CSC1/OSCA1-like 7TM region domain-containing protein n=1 Tax=Anisodus tanguticus TaxID=243964 RepID=A0AAE1RN34_9SOLA|nr:hypothetical protein RND71_026927 [Anisodus tanguticus]
MEGSISRSGRKRSACIKVLCFFIWNVFCGNILSGTVIERLNKIVKDVNYSLSMAVPSTKTIVRGRWYVQQGFDPSSFIQWGCPVSLEVLAEATFFMIYVLTSSWASLSVELLQPFGLICGLFSRFILRNMDASSHGTLTFPYHTEVPRILLFGLFGFAYAILAPLMLPVVVIYFSIAYLVCRNQCCRQRFEPLFKYTPAQTLIEMDRQDEEECGRMKEMHQRLTSAYCQFKSTSFRLGKVVPENDEENMSIHKVHDVEDINPGS